MSGAVFRPVPGVGAYEIIAALHVGRGSFENLSCAFVLAMTRTLHPR